LSASAAFFCFFLPPALPAGAALRLLPACNPHEMTAVLCGACTSARRKPRVLRSTCGCYICRPLSPDTAVHQQLSRPCCTV
jgi:hypothetical protein